MPRRRLAWTRTVFDKERDDGDADERDKKAGHEDDVEGARERGEDDEREDRPEHGTHGVTGTVDAKRSAEPFLRDAERNERVPRCRPDALPQSVENENASDSCPRG